MATTPPGIYLVVQFNWPAKITREMAQNARALHDVLQGEHGWVREAVAGSGGLGGGPSSLWIFWLENYAGLDRLLHSDDPISQAYLSFFSDMVDVSEMLREQVAFI